MTTPDGSNSTSADGFRAAPRSRRFELKYLIDELQADGVRRYCHGHLLPDSHASDTVGHTYPVLTTYLDSPGADLLWQTLSRAESRFKLRRRTYRMPDAPHGLQPTFLEIKRKVQGVVMKTRVEVTPRTSVRDAFDESDFAAWQPVLNGRSSQDYGEFCELTRRISARPVVSVFYVREAYQGKGLHPVRVTLDRDLRCGVFTSESAREAELWYPVMLPGVICEIKFNNAYPFWVANMLHCLDMQRRGICKYVLCYHAGGGRRYEQLKSAVQEKCTF